MKNVLFTVLVCLPVSCFAQQTANSTRSLSPTENTLIAQSEAISQAQKGKDTETLQRLLTDDFQEVGSEGKLHPRPEFLDDAKEGKLKDFTLYNLSVLAVNDNTAIVTYDAIIHEPEGDDGLAPRYQHVSDIWVKQADQWRLRFQQATARRPID